MSHIRASSHTDDGADVVEKKSTVSQTALLSQETSQTIKETLAGGARIVKVKDMLAIPDYAWLDEYALRHLISEGTPRTDFYGNPTPTNGFDQYGVVIRIGRGKRKRLLIDLDAFDRWLDAHRDLPLTKGKK